MISHHGKEYEKECVCITESLCCQTEMNTTLYTTIERNAGLEEAQAGIKIAGIISITSDMQMTPPLWQKVKRN